MITDENSKTLSVTYNDPYFWRPASATDPLANTVHASYTPTSIEAYLNFGASSTLDQLTTVDALGRQSIVQKRQAPGSSTFDSTQTSYSWTSTGAATTKSVPYAGAAGNGAPGGTAVTTQYDALGRVMSKTDGGNGTISYTYTNQDVLQTVGPSQTFQKQFEYDGLGRLTSVCEITTATGSGTCGQSNSPRGFWTRYKYDALGRMTGVCQKTTVALGTDCVTSPSTGQETRTFVYDNLGRMTSETNPETGTTAYNYDTACGSTGYAASAGDLTKRTDNASNVTCYAYDALHRLTDSGNGGSTCRHFRYDSQTPPGGVIVSNTKARTAEAYTDNCSGTKRTDEWFGYDANGNNTDFYESTPNSGGFYRSQASYWANGSLNALSLLNKSGASIIPTVYYGANNGSGLDGEGRITQVTAASGTNPTGSITYATSNSTSAFTGLLTGLTFPSGDSDSFAYDPSTGRQTQYSFQVNGATDTGTINWNANGTLGSYAISDNLSGTGDTQSCSYSYDDLGRSASVGCGARGNQSFTYDAFGNISKTANGVGVSFLPTSYNASSQPTGVSMSFDTVGNVKTDNLGTTYNWDPNFGNPAKINSTNLVYDASGQMVEQQNGSTYTQMLYSQMGKTAIMNGQTLSKAFVSLPGGGTAIYNASGTLANYRHADWLGNSRLTTTTSRTVSSSSAYAPFGEQFATSGTVDPSFTGQNSDTNSGLYDFTFREYSPSQGRWVSPDPAGVAAADPSSPQSWNRYAYVQNNPMRYIDPLGLILCDYGLSEDGNEDFENADSGGECTSNNGTLVNDQETVVVSAGIDYTSLLPDASYGVYSDSYSFSFSIPGSSGGGSGNAPNNGKPQPSCGRVWGQAIAGTLLDATGLIPGEGTIASGIKIVGTVGGIALSASGSLRDATAGGIFTGVGMYADAAKQEFVQVAPTLGKDVAEGIPGLGTFVSLGAVVWDLGSGAQSIYNCYHGVKE